jgi:hypothetical protein
MANLSKGRDAKLKGLHYDGSQLPKDVLFIFFKGFKRSIQITSASLEYILRLLQSTISIVIEGG